MNMFWQHYLDNKSPTLLVCILQQVYAAILQSSKINNLFQNGQTYIRRIVESSLARFL